MPELVKILAHVISSVGVMVIGIIMLVLAARWLGDLWEWWAKRRARRRDRL